MGGLTFAPTVGRAGTAVFEAFSDAAGPTKIGGGAADGVTDRHATRAGSGGPIAGQTGGRHGR
ncbi:MAG TPA: hypothetical protein VEA69_03635 [Tepidisphaeraceae bacterium]|nr:hypothetical protein [Tepidisphaeraceae bacterium]